MSPAKVAAVLVVVSACATFGYTWSAISQSYMDDIGSNINATGFNPSPTHSPCSSAPNPKFTNAFWAHMAYMSLAFGLFAPIGAVSYTLVRDVLGLPHAVAKALHGLLLLGSLITSIIGYQQIYYAHGANCKDAAAYGGSKHFQSIHSYVGIVVLVLFWWQWPSGLLVFGTSVFDSCLAKGTEARASFLAAHRFVGAFGVCAGLGTVFSGILIFDGKRSTTDPLVPEQWYMFARAGTAVFVCLFFLGLHLATSRSPATGGKAVDQPLVVAVGDLGGDQP